MQPFNYNIDVGNPTDSFMKGVQQRYALQDRDRAEQAAMAAQRQQVQMQADLSELSQNPNPSATDFARISIKYPQLAEHFKNTQGVLDTAQQRQKIQTATQVYSAINAGRPEIAKDLLAQQAEAYRNSGNERDAAGAEAISKIVEASPENAKMTTGLYLSSIMGPDKFADVLNGLTKTPLEAEKLQAETANLPTKYKLENQEKFEDIESKRLKRQLDTLDAQINAADSETKRGELQLKRDEVSKKLDDTGKAAQGALNAVSGQIATIDKILASPMLDDKMGQVGSIWRSTVEKIPGTQAKDFENLVDTVKSQQFLSNLSLLKAQGGSLGQVTEKEGERLEKALASLSTDQSANSFKAAATSIKKSLQNISNQIVAEGRLPKTGGAFILKHPKYGNVSDSTINTILAKNPGATKEQVI